MCIGYVTCILYSMYTCVSCIRVFSCVCVNTQNRIFSNNEPSKLTKQIKPSKPSKSTYPKVICGSESENDHSNNQKCLITN